MFKSLSDSLRSLWYQGTNEVDQRARRKRKRQTNAENQDDSDVEVVSVKIPKKENSGLLSFLKVPMSKMSEWVRRKTVQQDHFFVRPIPADSHWHKKKGAEEEPQVPQDSLGELDARNGELTHDHLQDRDRLSRPPVHSRKGAYANGVNGERRSKEQHAGVLSSSGSSRRSSCSSSRPGTERQSTVDKCFHLKEREDYLKLLQQFTTVDLGYHGRRKVGDHRQGTSGEGKHSGRKSGLYLPVQSAPSCSTSQQTSLSRPDVRQPSARLRVTPSRFFHTSSLSSSKVAEHPVSSSSSSRGRFAVPRRPGRALQMAATPGLAGRTQQGSVPPDVLGASSDLKAASPVSTDDQSIKTTPEPDVHQRLKATQDTDVKQQLKVMPQRPDRQLEVTSDSDQVSQRLRGPPVSDTDRSPVEGHNASLIIQPSPSLNFKSSEYLDEEWLKKLNQKYASSEMERQRLIREAEIKKKLLEERREIRLRNLGKKLEQQMRLFEQEPEVIEELPLPEVPQEKPLPELTESMVKEIRSALADGPPNQVLAEGFRLQLTRADIATLRGLNWLNDEVINFYMNMLMERGEQEGFSKAYAFNTFFYPKLLAGGHDAVKRWTRRVDVFDHHYLIIPVHLGVHWCLCMVFVKDKVIRYYDSMGGNNNQCLNAVRQYLADESMQKKNVQLDLSQWTSEIVKDIPQQMNGSDCGMFTCMYAETLTRGEQITFTQKDMPYFRKRMVYEILKKKLL